MSIWNIAAAVLTIITSVVQAIERPGAGAAKQQQAVAAIKAVIATLPIPAWAKAVFTFTPLLSYLVDQVVSRANDAGDLQHSMMALPASE